jgi:hypothetical protein
MASTRTRRKKQTQSRKKNRYPLEERHRRGLSATVRAAQAKAAKTTQA